jgi:hypothetical protein
VLAGGRTGAHAARDLGEPANPLESTAKRWMPEGERTFKWTPIPGAVGYSFTIFDQSDNILWSTRTIEARATYPSDLPELIATDLTPPAKPGETRGQKLYVYRLIPLGRIGKPMPGRRWGVITFLKPQDAMQLEAELKEIEPLLAADPTDATLLMLRAHIYRRYDVLQMVLESLQPAEFFNEPGEHARREVLRQISRIAYAWGKTDLESEKAAPTP